jgi:hypothetical protein
MNAEDWVKIIRNMVSEGYEVIGFTEKGILITKTCPGPEETILNE